MLTPNSIGFLTYLNGPVITKCFGGSHGANVPWPIVANWRMQMTKRAIPAMTIGAAEMISNDEGRY